MDSLIVGPLGANRPAFRFERQFELSVDHIPTGQLKLTCPSEKLDADHWPVRGDLAHIRLAGRCFVPHYAVPMEHVVKSGGATLRKAGRADGDALAELSGGEVFNVLDMAGGWAWGQQGEAGYVGYLPLEVLGVQ